MERDAHSLWLLPSETPSFDRAEVHVFRCGLDLEAPRLEALRTHLSVDERARAERFRFPRDREHFIASRGLLREILALYTPERPERLRFRYGPNGKPALDLEDASPPLRFNLSHSGSLALYALAWGRELGVDIEAVRPGVEGEGIAERFFSRSEMAALTALPPDLRAEGFFHCWTRKEAYIKARGEGLSMPLDCFDVSLAPGQPAAILATRGEPAETARWSLRALDAGPGYAAALAVEGRDFRLRLWQWPMTAA